MIVFRLIGGLTVAVAAFLTYLLYAEGGGFSGRGVAGLLLDRDPVLTGAALGWVTVAPLALAVGVAVGRRTLLPYVVAVVVNAIVMVVTVLRVGDLAGQGVVVAGLCLAALGAASVVVGFAERPAG